MGSVCLLYSLQSPLHAADEPPKGDTYDSSGLVKFQSAIEKIHPGIFIHSVYVDPDPKEDKRATFVRPQLSSPPRFSRL